MGQPARRDRAGRGAATACWPAATSTAARSRPRWWPTSWASTASTWARSVGTPAPGRGVPHQHRARRAAGAQAHRRPLSAWSPRNGRWRAGHGPALGRPRARLPGRRAGRAARAAPRPDPRAARPPADYLSLMATVASRARAAPARRIPAHRHARRGAAGRRAHAASRCTCARARWARRCGWTRGSRSASPRSRSSTSRACCARTARRRSTTWCCTSGWRSSAPARPTPRGCRWPSRCWPSRAGCGPAGPCSAAAPGLICAALAAFNPFLTVYAQETRMYSLMVVLSLLLSAAFLHVFVFRRRSYLPLFVGPARGHPLHPQLGHLRDGGHARGARRRCSCRATTAARCSRTRLIGYGVAVAALRAVAAHAALPDGPHRGAVAELAPARAPRSRSPRRCSAAAPSPWRCCSPPAPGWRRCSRARTTYQGARRDDRGAHDRRRHAGGRLALLAGLAGVDHPLPRRGARARSSCWPRVGLARAGQPRARRPGDHPRHLGHPARPANLENKSNAADLASAVADDMRAGRPGGHPPARAAPADALPPAQRHDRGHPARRGASARA